MSSGASAAWVTTGQDDAGVPFGTRLQDLAEQLGNELALVTLAPGGGAQGLTFAQLDTRANQWGRALVAAGAEIGSLVALAIPNSEHLVLAPFRCRCAGICRSGNGRVCWRRSNRP
jgi:bile acid-coenzyme A ligase